MTNKKKDWGKFVEDVIKLDEVVREGKTEKVSNCCYARVDNGRCSACKENCED